MFVKKLKDVLTLLGYAIAQGALRGAQSLIGKTQSKRARTVLAVAKRDRSCCNLALERAIMATWDNCKLKLTDKLLPDYALESIVADKSYENLHCDR